MYVHDCITYVSERWLIHLIELNSYNWCLIHMIGA